MLDRRYSDEDARRILALAADTETAVSAAASDSWTLEELQRAGAEAGLAPSSIAAAALSIERKAPADARLLGLPVAVSRAVPLPRTMTDADWQQLVSQLRATFDAEGRVRVIGERREWRVGNLRVTHEPTGDGALLDLRTLKGDAMVLVRTGAVILAAAAIGAVVLVGRQDMSGLAAIVLVGATGLASIVMGAARLPAWASARTRQFASLADYARRLVGP